MLANAFRSEESRSPRILFLLSGNDDLDFPEEKLISPRCKKKSHSSSRLRLICDFSSGKQCTRRKNLLWQISSSWNWFGKNAFFLSKSIMLPHSIRFFFTKNPPNPWWVLGCSFEFRNSTLLLQQEGGWEEIKQSRTLTPTHATRLLWNGRIIHLLSASDTQQSGFLFFPCCVPGFPYQFATQLWFSSPPFYHKRATPLLFQKKVRQTRSQIKMGIVCPVV